MPNRGTQVTQGPIGGPRKVNGAPDLRYKANEKEGTRAYDSRHRNPHPGQPSPLRQRHDRPVGDKDDVVNADGTLDMRFLENRVKAGLVSEDTVNMDNEVQEEETEKTPAPKRGRARH